MSPLRATLLVGLDAFRRAIRGGRLVLLLFLCALPVLVALVTVQASADLDIRHYAASVYWILLQLVVPFGALFLGNSVMADEIEGRTITYLFTRPLPRWVFLVGRLLGFLLAFTLLVAVSTVAAGRIYAEELPLEGADILGVLGAALLGVAAYVSVFALLRLWFRRALFVGFLLVFVFEVAISKFPYAEVNRYSIWHHLAVMTTRVLEKRHALDLPILEGIARDETLGGSAVVLGAVTVVAVVLGVVRIQRSEIVVPGTVA